MAPPTLHDVITCLEKLLKEPGSSTGDAEQVVKAYQAEKKRLKALEVVGPDGVIYANVWKRDLATEPLLQEDPTRFILYPVRHHDVFDLYDKLERKLWFPHEIDIDKDIHDFQKLTRDEQLWLENTLAFFAASDGIVLENLVNRVHGVITMTEAKAFFNTQIGNEQVHSRTYSEFIRALVSDPARRDEMFTAVINTPVIAKKAQWALQFTNDMENVSLAELLIAYACVEGIMFSSSFACIFKLRSKNLFPGLSFANRLISGDELKHMTHGLLLYCKYIKNALPSERILEIVRSAVDVECDFVDQSLPNPVQGMDAESMKEYVRFMGNFLVRHIPDTPDPYPEVPTNTLDFMDLQGQEMVTNFFERKVGEYQQREITEGDHDTKLTVDLDDVDF